MYKLLDRQRDKEEKEDEMIAQLLNTFIMSTIIKIFIVLCVQPFYRPFPLLQILVSENIFHLEEGKINLLL